MSRSRIALALAATVALASSQALKADVRSEEKTKVQLGGALGRVVNMFGGRAARDGVTETVAVKGNRMMTFNENNGEIVDLAEEKIYTLDMKKKSYTVTTFAERRRQIEEQRRKAEEQAKKDAAAEKDEPARQDPDAKQMEVDFEVKNTGEKKDINGFGTSQAVMTITVREKGKTLQQSGGLVMTSDMWLTPSIPAMKEIAEFRQKYYEKLYGPLMGATNPQDMAAALAMYPMMKPALEKMAAEGRKLQGTPVLTTTTFDAVKSPEQMQAAQSGGDTKNESAPTSIGGVIGGFGRRMAQRKKDNDDAANAGPKDRSTIVTSTNEVLKVATSVSAEDVAIPAGFKESK